MKKTFAKTGTVSRRDFIFSMAAAGLGKTISLNSSQPVPNGVDNLESLVGIGQEPSWTRVLENNETYTLKLHSKWYQHGDLV